MKYLRVVIIVLVLVLTGVGIYYYLLVSGLIGNISLFRKEPAKPVETAIPFSYAQSSTLKVHGTEIIEYYGTKQLQSTDDVIKIAGNFQSTDKIDKFVDGERYVCVAGMLSSDNKLHRFWLTQEQCDSAADDLFINFSRDSQVIWELSSSVKMTPYVVKK